MPEPSPLDDLATRAIGGDAIALRAICERIQGPVYRLALRMLGQPSDAEDATQEIVIKAITRLATFEGRSALITWVYTIAVRHLMRVRIRARETATSADALAAQLDAGLALAAHATPLTAVEAPVLERELQLECTHGMFLVLSRPERIAYILSDVLGATDRIGAAICEIEPAAFRQRLSRARAQMRPLLAERCGLADARNPCRCERQAPVAFAAKLIDPKRLRYAKLAPEHDAALARADDQLGALRLMGSVFDRDAPLAAPRELWAKITHACPDLLR
jgi:RNA polymerase sigma factor (sigma-70 family)